MRDLNELEKYRVQPANGQRLPRGVTAYHVQTKRRAFLVLASVDKKNGDLVEHISVSHRNEKVWPTWEEMCEVKDMFFLPEEECVQIFPKKSEYVNFRTNCFHLWRPVNGTMHIGGGNQNG